MRLRVGGEYRVRRVEVGPGGDAGRDEGDVGGPGVGGLRLVEDDELVLVGVPVELPHHRVLEAAHHPGELPPPAAHRVGEAPGYVADDVHPVPGRLGVQELGDQPGQLAGRVDPLVIQPAFGIRISFL